MRVICKSYMVTVGAEEAVSNVENDPGGLSVGTREVVGAGVLGLPATKVCTLSRPNC